MAAWPEHTPLALLAIAIVQFGWPLSAYLTARRAMPAAPARTGQLAAGISFGTVIVGYIASMLLPTPPTSMTLHGLVSVVFSIGALTSFWLTGKSLIDAEAAKLGETRAQPASAIVFQLIALPVYVWFLQPRLKRLLD
jgi:hypothetical protein